MLSPGNQAYLYQVQIIQYEYNAEIDIRPAMFPRQR